MKNLPYISLLFALSAVVFACGPDKEQSIVIPEEMDANEIIITQSQFDKAEMEWDSLSDHSFSDFILTNGKVNIPAEGRFDVSSYFGGNIVQFDLLVGQKIQKGQVLFVIENPEFVQMQQDYLDAVSQLSYLKSDYERQKTLNAENISSQKNFAKAESDYKSTLAKTESLRKKLQLVNISTTQLDASKITSRAAIYAPISGYIEAIKVNQGTYLNPSDIALTIINKDHLHIELNVFEQDAIALEMGQPVTFYLPDNKSREFEGKIFLIGQSINSDEVNYVLELSHQENDLFYLKKTKIEVGLQDGQMIEILSENAFKPGTLFLSKGGFQLIK